VPNQINQAALTHIPNSTAIQLPAIAACHPLSDSHGSGALLHALAGIAVILTS
jgi:hypothetical protein